MTKAEKIQEAYGEHWESVKDYVDENGYVRFSDVNPNQMRLQEKYESINHSTEPLWRLIGIDLLVKNNGWIKIESEADLPKTSCKIDLLGHNGSEYDNHNYNSDDSPENYLKYYSHYQIRQKRKLPLY